MRNGRANSEWWGDRLGPDAMRHYWRYVWVMTIGMIPGAVSVLILMVFALIMMESGTNEAFASALPWLLSGLWGSVALLLWGGVEYLLVKPAAARYRGLTREESRKLDVWTPERFDASLAKILASRDRPTRL